MDNDNRNFDQEQTAAKTRHKQAKAAQKRAYQQSQRNGRGNVMSGFGTVGSQDGKLFAEGITNIYGGNFEEIYIEGICNSSTAIKASKLDVEGIFNCKGDIEAGELYCEGTAHIKGNVRAQNTNVEGVVDIKGRLETEGISCKGVIRVANEISADQIEARGVVVAREIVGDKVVIHSEVRSLFRKFLGDSEAVDLIEATTIELKRVKARVVNGHNIRIGLKCEIDRIDCSGTLYIDPSAMVGEITGNFQRVY